MLMQHRRMDAGTVLLLFPAAALIMIVLGAIVIDVSLSQVRARELEFAAASAANDALGALDVQTLRGTGQVRFDPVLAEAIVMESVAMGPLPTASVRSISISGIDGETPQIAVTLTWSSTSSWRLRSRVGSALPRSPEPERFRSSGEL